MTKRTPQKKQASPVSTGDEMWAAVKDTFMAAVEETREAVVEELQFEKLGNYTVSETGDWTDEDHSFAFSIDDSEGEPEIDVRFTLASSGAYEGIDEGEEGWGVNIAVDINGADGRMIGGFTPYNYTERVWTDDTDELLERIGYMNASEAAYLVVEDLKEQQAEEGNGVMASSTQKVARIIIGGVVYRQAEMDPVQKQLIDKHMTDYEEATRALLGKMSKQIETLTGTKDALEKANQATIGGNFGQSNQVLQQLEGVVPAEVLKGLAELNDTMAGTMGMSGN
jgi:hypothetical protein